MQNRLLAIAIIGFSLSGCFVGRIEELEKQQASVKQELEDLRSIQADHTASISDLKTEIRQLTGKVEELSFRVTGKTAELEKTLERVSSRVPPPLVVPEELLEMDEGAISRITGAAADSYRTALRQLRSGEFDSARQTFAAFLEQNPATGFSDNALYWIGVCFMGMGQFDRSISAFSDVFQRYPAEDFVPPSIFKLGESFIKMGSTKDAILAFQKLADDHPKSAWAVKARNQLKELGVGGGNPVSQPSGKKGAGTKSKN